MQRSALKEEKKENDEEPSGSFPSLGTLAKKCVVITDWDPRPGATLGRMSFQPFNPSIEKLNKDASPTSSSSNGGRMSFSEPECSKVEARQETNGGLKRKQSEEQNHPNKFTRKVQSSGKPSPNNKKSKKPKSRKVDWSVLKPQKPQINKGST